MNTGESLVLLKIQKLLVVERVWSGPGLGPVLGDFVAHSRSHSNCRGQYTVAIQCRLCGRQISERANRSFYGTISEDPAMSDGAIRFCINTLSGSFA
jgi:hypothetical protein